MTPKILIRWDDPGKVIGWVVDEASPAVVDRLRALTRASGGGAALILELSGDHWPARLKRWQAALIGEGVADVIAAWGTGGPQDRGLVAMETARSYARLWTCGYTPHGIPVAPHRAVYGQALVSYILEAA